MREDHEELILRNPVLGARSFWHFARNFADKNGGSPPELPFFCIAAAMIFNLSTVDKIKSMQFESGILKAILDRPDILVGLQARVETTFSSTLAALQVGTAAGILLREGGGAFPSFRAVGTDLNKEIRSPAGHVSAIFASSKRLGT